MQALRQRAACAVQRAQTSAKILRPATRSYASGHGPDGHHDAHHDDHHHAPEVAESIGWQLYAVLGALGGSMLVYNVSRLGENGELSALHQWIDKLRTTDQLKWEQRNTMRTDLLEQVAQDKNLFKTVPKRDLEYRTPELFNSGCPNNVPAGHSVNLDHVMEHYRKKHLDEEERKARKLAAAKGQ